MPLKFKNAATASTLGTEPMEIYRNHKLKNTFLIGIGAGYQMNENLRFDITGNYLGNAKLTAVNSYVGANKEGGSYGLKLTQVQDVRSIFGLANAYLGTSFSDGKFLPFVSVGVGYANNKTGDIQNIAVKDERGASVLEFGPTTVKKSGMSSSGIAYSAGVGLGMRLTDNMIVEAAYKYINLGKVKNNVNDHKTKIDSARLQLNTFTVGLRVLF